MIIGLKISPPIRQEEPEVQLPSSTLQSRIALNKALEALSEVEQLHDNYWSDKMEAFRDAWSDLLIYTSRVYAKAEQECKKIPGNWFSVWKSERRTDPLLSWFWHARNIDEHGLALVYEYDPGETKISGEVGKPFGLEPVVTNKGIAGVRALTPWTRVESSTPPQYLLAKVTDRGVDYPAPINHAGSLIDPAPYPVAKAYLDYLERMVSALEHAMP